jgi:hypothetical protein
MKERALIPDVFGGKPELEERQSSERWQARAIHLVGTGRMTELGTVSGSCETPRRNRKNDRSRNGGGLVRNWSPEPEERRCWAPNSGRRWEDFG